MTTITIVLTLEDCVLGWTVRRSKTCLASCTALIH